MKRRTLYLPIETKARELIGKTLLAAKAVERGWVVFLGQDRAIREQMSLGVPGLLVAIGIRQDKAPRFVAVKAQGHVIASLCEEGILYRDTETYFALAVGAPCLPSVDLLLASGTKTADDMRRYRPQAAEKVVVTGNPRFDTLLPGLRAVYQLEADAIRREFGRFLLVNTNFGLANPFKRLDKRAGEGLVPRLRKVGIVITNAVADELHRQTGYKARQMVGLQALLSEVEAAHRYERIVVRPHPGEDHNVWREWARPRNIDVRYDGNANAWMLGADTVIHPGCSTGVEGVLLDRMVTSYVPEPDSDFLHPSDEIGNRFSSAEELLACVHEQREEAPARAILASQREWLRPRIRNVTPPLAADVILDAFDTLDVPEVSVPRALRARLTRLFSRPATLKTSGKLVQKFPGLSEHDIHAPVFTWMSSGVLGRMPLMTRIRESLWQLS